MVLLTEEEVRRHLPMAEAIEAVRGALKAFGAGRVPNTPRARVAIGSTTLNVMSSAFPDEGVMGAKAYTTGERGPEAYYLLFSADGRLLCLMEADELGRIRTGATTGVATRLLARPGSRRALVVGAGFQADTQLLALATFPGLESIALWSRRRASAEAFRDRVADAVTVPVAVVEDLAAAVARSDIVTTVTSAPTPVIEGAWLKPGTHVNAVGSNRAHEAELDAAAVAAARLVVVDAVEEARRESGDLINAAAAGAFAWEDAVDLAHLLAGRVRFERGADDVTLFKSNGLALEDLAVARRVYGRALEAGALG